MEDMYWESSIKRADVVLYGPVENIVVDVTITLPFAHCNMVGAKGFKKPGDAAELAETRKLSSYKKLYDFDDKTNQSKLYILAAELWGPMSEGSLVLCKKIASLFGSDSSVTLRNIYQQISVCLINIRASQFASCVANYISPYKPSLAYGANVDFVGRG
jgi:hypothetical protein